MKEDAESIDSLLPRESSSDEIEPELEYGEKLRFRRSRNVKARFTTTRLPLVLGLLLGLSLILNTLLAIACRILLLKGRNHATDADIRPKKSPGLYSPAQDAIETKFVTFESSLFHDLTDYQGPPSDKNNQLWEDLYSHMNTHISAEEARLIPNKTAPEADYEGSGYLIVLHVFHDLHCLDKIRQAVYYFADDKWNATYNPYVLFDSPDEALRAKGGEAMGLEHLDHCIDGLRQSAQCHGDIAPTVFQYSPKAGFIGARANIVHECRDFSKIVGWADQHKSRLPFGGFGDGPELGKCGWDDPGSCLYE